MSKTAARKRIAAFERRDREKPLKVAVHSKIARGGYVDRVLCKLCGGTIKHLIPDELPVEVLRVKDRTMVYHRMILAELPNYVEVKIDFDDGSAHITHICKACFKSLQDDDLETLYVGDMQQQMAEEDAGYSEALWHFWDKRKPIGFKLFRMNGAEVK